MALNIQDRAGDFLPHNPSGAGAAIGGTVTSGTQGSVLYVGAGGALSQDNANFFYDDVDHQLVMGAGTVGKPSIIFGDDTSGLYRPAANQVAVSLSGVIALNVGAGTPDSDQSLGMGRLLVDSRTTDTVNMSHRDMTTTTNYGVQFGPTGFLGLNCASGQSGAIRANNVTKIAWNTTGIGFYGTTGTAQQNITGSRGANAALADLLTKLATIGLITDGTTA